MKLLKKNIYFQLENDFYKQNFDNNVYSVLFSFELDQTELAAK